MMRMARSSDVVAVCLCFFLMLDATADVHEYSSLFRGSTALVRDPGEESRFWKEVDSHPGVFDKLSFFSQNNHSVRPIAYHRENAKRAADLFVKVRARGMKPGVNVLTTLGFFGDHESEEMKTYPQPVWCDGNRLPGSLCPTAAQNRDYIRQLYTLYAKCGPDFIFIDDDVSAVAGCCHCTNCLSLFMKEHEGVLKKGTREELRGLLVSDDWKVRMRARAAWSKFSEDRVNSVCEIAAKAVHAVDPKIIMGYMTCMAGSRSLASARWAATLSESGKTDVYWRPGGGHWTEDSFMELVSKALRMTVQMHGLPTGSVSFGEVENWPYALRKSPDHMGFESLYYLGAGMTGLAFNLCNLTTSCQSEFAPYYARVAEMRPACQKIVRAMDDAPREGIAFAWKNGCEMDLSNKDWELGRDMPTPSNISSVGLPIATDPARAKVLLLDASLAAELSVESLTNVLSRGVMLDADALQILNQRGFADWTGFRCVHKTPRDAVTRYLKHPMTLRAGLWRDIRSAFGWHDAFSCIVKTGARAQYTEEAIDLDGNSLGLAGGIFENSHGGRIAVGAMLPFDWSEQYARSYYLKRLFRWLSRDKLPAYICSFCRASVFVSGDSVFVANLMVGRLSGAEIATLKGGMRKMTVFEGGILIAESVLSPIRTDGEYNVYALPVLPVNGAVLME